MFVLFFRPRKKREKKLKKKLNKNQLTSRVQQQVLKPFPKPRHVFRVFRGLAQLAPGQHVRRQPLQVEFDRLRRDGEKRPADEVPLLAVGVLAVAHAVVPLLGAGPVRALAVLEHVARARASLRVRHQGRRPPGAEQAVDQEHRPVVANVPPLGHVFVGDDDDLGALGQGGEELFLSFFFIFILLFW